MSKGRDHRKRATDGEAAKPDAAKAEAAKPDAAKAEAAGTEAAKPDAAKPDAAKPDAAKPDAAKPDAAKTAADGTLARAPEPKGAAPAAASGEETSAAKHERPRESQAPRRNETAAPARRLFVDPDLHAIDALDAEAVAIGICSDVRPLAGAAGYIDWRMCGKLSDLLRTGVVTGAAGEKVLLPTHGVIPAGRIFLFGWGPKRALLDNAVARLDWMAQVLKKAGVQRVAVALPEPAGILVGLVEGHLKAPLGDKLSLVFSPDLLMSDAKDTRPIPAAPPASSPPAPRS